MKKGFSSTGVGSGEGEGVCVMAGEGDGGVATGVPVAGGELTKPSLVARLVPFGAQAARVITTKTVRRMKKYFFTRSIIKDLPLQIEFL